VSRSSGASIAWKCVVSDFADLSELRAVVTGSSTGIGRAIALELARGGASVVVHCRRSVAEAEAVAAEIRELGTSAALIVADLAEADALPQFVDEAWKAFGGVDVWVNN